MAVNGDIKRVHTAEFKTQVALDLLKETDTLGRIASKYGIHPTQARRWREIAIAALKNVFTGKPPDAIVVEKDKQISELTALIGKKEIELDWVKKKAGLINH